MSMAYLFYLWKTEPRCCLVPLSVTCLCIECNSQGQVHISPQRSLLLPVLRSLDDLLAWKWRPLPFSHSLGVSWMCLVSQPCFTCCQSTARKSLGLKLLRFYTSVHSRYLHARKFARQLPKETEQCRSFQKLYFLFKLGKTDFISPRTERQSQELQGCNRRGGGKMWWICSGFFPKTVHWWLFSGFSHTYL